MFTSILAATDRITRRDPVVVTAARLAGALKVPWSIIHVLESASLGNRRQILHFRTGRTQEATIPYMADVRRQLQGLYHDLLVWTPTCSLGIVTGFPWEEIAAQAYRLKADLIVMGPHSDPDGPHTSCRVVGRIGSTLEGVIAHERAPVLIINQHPCRPKPVFKRILVGLDFSASCASALAFAVELARFYQAAVDLFHMLPVPPYPKYSRADYKVDREGAHTRMAAFVQSRLDGLPHECHVWGGVLPYREVLRCAAKCGSDAIVLGSHTKETAGKWYAGSTVEKVSLQASCPVFVLTDVRALPSLKNRVSDETPAPSPDPLIHVFEKKSAASPS